MEVVTILAVYVLGVVVAAAVLTVFEEEAICAFLWPAVLVIAVIVSPVLIGSWIGRRLKR